MAAAKLTKLEMRVMEALWSGGQASVREIQQALPAKNRPAYTTVQTLVYRLEAKKVVRRVKKVGNAHVFEPVITRAEAQHRIIDDLLAYFDGQSLPLVARLIETGRLTPDDVKEAEQLLENMEKDDERSR